MMDYNNNQYYGGVNPSFRNPGITMASVSLFCGIASFFSMMTVFLPVVFGGLAILFALLSKGYGRKMITQAKIGLICGIGGFCITGALFVSSLSMLLRNPDILLEIGKQYDAAVEQMYGESAEDLYGTSFEEIMKQYADRLRR